MRERKFTEVEAHTAIQLKKEAKEIFDDLCSDNVLPMRSFFEFSIFLSMFSSDREQKSTSILFFNDLLVNYC